MASHNTKNSKQGSKIHKRICEKSIVRNFTRAVSLSSGPRVFSKNKVSSENDWSDFFHASKPYAPEKTFIFWNFCRSLCSSYVRAIKEEKYCRFQSRKQIFPYYSVTINDIVSSIRNTVLSCVSVVLIFMNQY